MTPPVSPRVSIIIPTYNGARLLARTIGSVLDQTMTDWELVISDDGSTDETVDVARSFAEHDPRIRILPESNTGVAAARNRGLAATHPGSDYVILLDHDDRWLPDALETLVGVLDERPELVSVYGLACCIDGDDRPTPGDDLQDRMRERFELRGHHLAAIEPQEPTTFAAMIHHNYPITPGLHLVRRHVVERVGPFDPHAVPADDWDMHIRISRVGPIGFSEQLVLQWRRHEGAQSDLSDGWRRANYHVRAKAYCSPDNTAEQTRLARAAYVESFRAAIGKAWSNLRGRKLAAGLRSLVGAGEVAVRLASVTMLRPVRLGRFSRTRGART